MAKKTMSKPRAFALDPLHFGLAAGIFFGLIVFFTTLVSANNGYGAMFLNLLMSIYPGYKITYVGSLIGLVYGFLDGFIGCYVFAWLYNYLLGH